MTKPAGPFKVGDTVIVVYTDSRCNTVEGVVVKVGTTNVYATFHGREMTFDAITGREKGGYNSHQIWTQEGWADNLRRDELLVALRTKHGITFNFGTGRVPTDKLAQLLGVFDA